MVPYIDRWFLTHRPPKLIYTPFFIGPSLDLIDPTDRFLKKPKPSTVRPLAIKEIKMGALRHGVTK